MSDHSCDAVIVTCIDFRFQPFINKWIADNFQPKTYDRIAFAGGVHDFDTILHQVEISHRLHHTQKVILINHEDCGAYGEKGTDEKHAEDLRHAAGGIKAQFEDMEVESYYLRMSGTFEKVS